MDKRTFYIDFRPGICNHMMRCRVESALELFNLCMRYRFSKYIRWIVQYTPQHPDHRVLAVVDSANPDILEAACAEAWACWRPKSNL